ncbi:helix-turn-helix transcriptional regulator [Agreia sp.]|uniref:AraC family transcriptional regulator n=1 Tax=Agreia sp. TaxID=1872416 RepID=UPI0035BC411E
MNAAPRRFTPRLPASTALNGPAGIENLSWHTQILCEDPSAFRGTIHVVMYDRLSIGRIQHGPARQVRSSEMVAALDVGTTFVCVNRFPLTVTQNGTDIAVHPGEVFMLSGRFPYEISGSDGVDTIAITMASRDDWEAGAIDHLRVLPKSRLTSPTTYYVQALCRQLPRPGTLEGESAQAVIETMMLGLASTLRHDEDTTAARWAQYRSDALAYIGRNFRDVAVNAPTVASAVALSLRQLQRIFAYGGLTVNGAIRETRLLHATSLLSDSRWATSSLADIAAASGFDGTAALRRAFKTVYGMSPGEFRVDPPRTPDTALTRYADERHRPLR